MTTAPPRPPRVSVCIPTYCGASHIRATIDSVLGQTFRDLEVVIIDNASPDDTFAVASSYDDPRVRCLRNASNLGAEGNWNRCLAEATGTYVKLLPDDDVLAPECLQRQVDVLQADTREEIALVFCARRIIDGEGRLMFERRMFGRAPRRLTGRALFRRCLYRGTNVIGEPGGTCFAAVSRCESEDSTKRSPTSSIWITGCACCRMETAGISPIRSCRFVFPLEHGAWPWGPGRPPHSRV